jgi:hypothetical protein
MFVVPALRAATEFVVRRKALIVGREALPTRLHDAGNLALQRQRAEAQTADAELAQVSAWTAAYLATVVLAGLEFRLACVFHSLCCCCHRFASCLFENFLLNLYGVAGKN